jgi:hypothetical protein
MSAWFSFASFSPGVVIGCVIGSLIFHWIEKRFLAPRMIKRILECIDSERPEPGAVFARVFSCRVSDAGFFGDYEFAFAEACDAAGFVERRLSGEYDADNWWKHGAAD